MASVLMPNLELPWSSSIDDDKRFTKIVSGFLVAMLVVSAVVTLVNLPDVPRAEKEKLPPQLARVVLEKQELPPPKPIEPPKPEPKPEEKKPEPKPVEKKPEPKPVVKPKEPVKAPPKEAVEKAREQASNSGVMQFKDDLAEMREMMQTSAVETAATTVTNSSGEAAQLDRAMITSGAKKASGGINTAALSRDTGGTALSGRETTKVTSTLADSTKKANQATAGNSNGAGGAARSEEDIRKVMNQHKGAIDLIYNRALRQNASLQGKMVVKIVIDPSGKIVEASMVSSELGDPELEAKILQRIKLISFPAANVARFTLNQSFDFFPK
ncbi:AgmX/PglI C-terminal domain-containing protein [Cellvibrio sp. NN19]|uniref:AgmX/PglI C-terminal domain-containing protein n=1 Tax=Cellvibrio chitinivorans TaxID=3102792 RepID=UPI002B40C4CB|nr:AgmX/PglI C-terminal domain-containing protein [Cellvibrio sp. NN19]